MEETGFSDGLDSPLPKTLVQVISESRDHLGQIFAAEADADVVIAVLEHPRGDEHDAGLLNRLLAEFKSILNGGHSWKADRSALWPIPTETVLVFIEKLV
jgi:hypothetical protein